MKLAFYIHVPYCSKRCGYCDFNTYTPTELKISTGLNQISNSYIDLVIKEIELAKFKIKEPVEVSSIFFGGGTPSLMEPVDLGRVITKIKTDFGIASNAEITLEVNPDSVDRDKLELFFEIGINRLSIGMQSAVSKVLKILDRTHNPENVERAVSMARAAGFEHVSVDLIYGSPGESMDDWRRSVEYALALDIDHISAYALIVEKGTKLAAQINRGELTMPPDDQSADKYLLADQLFEAAGFNWYELSNWSKPGGQCRHNIAYWDGSFWWGVGAGAHSYLN
ncbi:MAG: radical SAM family heme chaperone HemW, partial [Actinobacteria bacterium]|nr:radical SAM family heme chaperone HemW [Actinomycetota bacterium]